MGKVLFKEVQRGSRWWSWLIVPVWLAYLSWRIFGTVEAIGSGEASWGDSRLAVFILLWVAAVAVISRTMFTRVQDDGLYIRILPFSIRAHRVSLDNVTKVVPRSTLRSSECAWFGIKRSSDGVSYCMSTDGGVEIHYADGRRALVGSRSPEELAAAIQAALPRRAGGIAQEEMPKTQTVAFHETQTLGSLDNRVFLPAAMFLIWIYLLSGFLSEPSYHYFGGFAWFSLCLVGVVFASIAKLETHVRGDGVYVRTFPIQLSFRRIPLDRATRCEVTFYTGRGYFWGSLGKKKRAYTIKGKSAVRIDYSDGTHVLIGSQIPDDLCSSIRAVLRDESPVPTTQ